MKNRLKNGIMLTVLASAMIACNGGSGSSTTQSQPPGSNLQLPEPEVLDSDFSSTMSSIGSKAAPFIATSMAVVKAFAPGLADALGIAQFGVGIVNLLDPSAGFGQVLTKLGQISNQITQLDNQMLTEINLTRAGFYGLFTKFEDFQTEVFSSDFNTKISIINNDYGTVKGAYDKFVNSGIFGNVSYSNAIESMYSYANSHCTNATGIIEFTQMQNINSLQFNKKYINNGTYWSDFFSERQSYISTITQRPESDIALGLANYNSSAFHAMTQLYAAFDEMRMMQLAQAAYYYACPDNIDSSKISQNFLNNLSDANSLNIPASTTLSSESIGYRYESYENVAKFIYTAYDNEFQNLKKQVAANLAPIPNQFLVESVNTQWFSSIGTPLLASSFGELAPLGSIPHTPYDCNVKRFTLENTNTFVNMTAICLVESNSMQYTYRTVNHAIPVKMSSLLSIVSTYGYANLYYDESGQTIKSPATNLSIPISESAPGYNNSSTAIMLMSIGSPITPISLFIPVESDIFVFGSPWTNLTPNSNGLNSTYDLLTQIINQTNYVSNNQYLYGYKTVFNSPNPGLSQLAKSGNITNQSYFTASYKGHMFYIQFLVGGNYDGEINGTDDTDTSYYMTSTGGSYFTLHCATKNCSESNNSTTAQLTWDDGTKIQVVKGSYTDISDPAYIQTYKTFNIQVANTPNNVVTRKIFQFESDSLVADWMNKPTHLHHKAYLNGRIKYKLKAGVESTPIFVSKNYAYRLAYIANSSNGSLQIQSNNNDGTWSTTATVATAPDGATDLYLTGGDIMLINTTTAGESIVWSVSQQYRTNNIHWAPDIYAEVMVTNNGQLNIYVYDKNNQAGVRGTSPDDANYSRMLWSSSNFPWASVNHGTLLQPTGSYTSTASWNGNQPVCNNISWAPPKLSASCLNSTGGLIASTLDYTTCSGNSTVSNQNGTLTCDTLNKSRPR